VIFTYDLTCFASRGWLITVIDLFWSLALRTALVRRFRETGAAWKTMDEYMPFNSDTSDKLDALNSAATTNCLW